MRALILAAGFGTRLEKSFDEYVGPHKEQLRERVYGKPKSLVHISGKNIIDHQLEQLKSSGININDIYVHTNAKYYQQFLEWAETSGIPAENIFNNGVEKNEDKNEQMKDLLLALSNIGYDQPLFLFASDTLVYGNDGLLNLTPMIESYQKGLSSVVVCHKEEKAYNHGVITIDEQGMLTNFEEKPEGVEAGFINVSVYLFSPDKLQQMKKFSEQLLQNCKNPLELLTDKVFVVEAVRRLDVGTIEDVLGANF